MNKSDAPLSQEELKARRPGSAFRLVAASTSLHSQHAALAIRLGACLNSLRAIQRWYAFLETDNELGRRATRDKILAFLQTCACIGETLRVLHSGGNTAIVAEWLTVAESTDEHDRLDGILNDAFLRNELRRLRDKVVAHWDTDVFQSYIDQHQSTEAVIWAEGATEAQIDLVMIQSDEAVRSFVAGRRLDNEAEARFQDLAETVTVTMRSLGTVLEKALAGFIRGQGGYAEKMIL